MEALGYKAKRTLSGVVVTEARANLELEQEITAHTETKRTLELEQVRREAAEKEVSDLRESLASERANNEVLRALIPKELESGKRARWWRK